MRTLALVTMVVALAMGSGMSRAQSAPNSTTPQHPISTAPEGTNQTCSWTASRSSDGKATGESTCQQPVAGGASAAQKFPYPGDPAPDAAPSAAENPDTPQPAGASPQQSGGPAKQFPYPGENRQPTGTSAAQSGPLRDAGSSGESSSSSSSSSDAAGTPAPEDGGGPDQGALPAPKRARKKLPPVARQSPDEREQEDVQVAGFYQNDGNFRAAYLRAKDAVGLMDTDPDAHFALAEAARKLGKLDEAEQHYKRCLELDPVPKEKKATEKALKEMSGS